MAGTAEKIEFAAKIAGVNVDDLADYLVVEGIQNFDNVTAQDIASRYVNSGLFD